MKLKLFTLLVVLTALLLFGGLAHAESTVTQVTTNSYEDSFPQIEGNYVVWQGQVGGDWEVFLYDTATGLTTQITDNDYDDISPKTDGDYVVWLGFSYSGGEIFVYDIASGSITQITDDDNIDCPPEIADGYAVWTSHEVTASVEPGEIFLHDIAGGLTIQLTYDTLDDSSPRINAEIVMWVQTDEEDYTTLFIHDMVTWVTSEAPEGFVWPDSPQTDGNLRVLTRHDGEDREVLVYDSSSRTYHQITDNGLQDRYPSISGNRVAWVADGEIFLAALPSLQVSIRPNTIVVEGGQNVRVVVRDERRRKVRGAVVTLSGCGIRQTKITNRGGRVHFRRVNPTQTGSIEVTVTKDGFPHTIGSVAVEEAVFRAKVRPRRIRLAKVKPHRGVTIRVIAQNRKSRKPVAGAEVTISGCGIDETQVTNIRGRVIFRGLVPTETGSIYVDVGKDGYTDWSALVSVR